MTKVESGSLLNSVAEASLIGLIREFLRVLGAVGILRRFKAVDSFLGEEAMEELLRTLVTQLRHSDAWDVRLGCALGLVIKITLYRRRRSIERAYEKSRSPEINKKVVGAG